MTDRLEEIGRAEYQPQPSSRDDAFIARCRWATFYEAWSAAERAHLPVPKRRTPAPAGEGDG